MNIGLDFDGTLAQYSGFAGMDVTGEPLPGALSFLKALHELGCHIAIFSARAKDARGKLAIERWLDQHGVRQYVELVTHEKLPDYDVIIDDRAIHFDGDYKVVLKELLRRSRSD